MTNINTLPSYRTGIFQTATNASKFEKVSFGLPLSIDAYSINFEKYGVGNHRNLLPTIKQDKNMLMKNEMKLFKLK